MRVVAMVMVVLIGVSLNCILRAGGELVTSNTPLLQRSREQGKHLLGEIRDHGIDLVIASCYFAGSGIPGTSSEWQWIFNVVASGLWITDSTVRIILKCQKRRELQRQSMACLQEIATG